jgi:hypothetical protein
MLRRILIFLALYCGSVATALAGDQLNEVRKSFTIGGNLSRPKFSPTSAMR